MMLCVGLLVTTLKTVVCCLQTGSTADKSKYIHTASPNQSYGQISMVYLHLTPFLWACVFSNEHSLCRCFVFQSNGKPAGLFIQCPRLQLTKKKHEDPTGKRKARKTQTSNLHCNEKEQSVNACLAQK